MARPRDHLDLRRRASRAPSPRSTPGRGLRRVPRARGASGAGRRPGRRTTRGSAAAARWPATRRRRGRARTTPCPRRTTSRSGSGGLRPGARRRARQRRRRASARSLRPSSQAPVLPSTPRKLKRRHVTPAAGSAANSAPMTMDRIVPPYCGCGWHRTIPALGRLPGPPPVVDSAGASSASSTQPSEAIVRISAISARRRAGRGRTRGRTPRRATRRSVRTGPNDRRPSRSSARAGGRRSS